VTALLRRQPNLAHHFLDAEDALARYQRLAHSPPTLPCLLRLQHLVELALRMRSTADTHDAFIVDRLATAFAARAPGS
jgi:hypothetical protein